MSAQEYPFMTRLGRTIKAGTSRAVVLTGNVQDLFFLEGRDAHVPLLDYLAARCNVTGSIPVTYELNGPIRFPGKKDPKKGSEEKEDREKVRDAWVRFQTGRSENELKIDAFLDAAAKRKFTDVAAQFDETLEAAKGNATLALEFLRWLCACSRAERDGKPLLGEDLIILIEGADLMVPDGTISTLSEANLHRIAVCRDWFSDLGFTSGGDTVVLIAESRSQLHGRVAQMPQLVEIAIPSPTLDERQRFIEWFIADAKKALEAAEKKALEAAEKKALEHQPTDRAPKKDRMPKLIPKLWGSAADLAQASAGLSIHALRQLLVESAYTQQSIALPDVTVKVEAYICGQLGDDVVEFKRPEHTRADVVGVRDLKVFADTEIIPGLRLTTKDALGGMIVCGSIGVGKTYFLEALAGELGIPVLVIKNVRSKWFGETDVIFERLRRVLEALFKVIIYVNEADTQFGGVGQDAHETERRLTGKIQAMMSDPRLRGKVHWILDTARVQNLSPDIRRPGRGGDLIVAMFDPDGEDRKDFVRWTVEDVLVSPPDDAVLEEIDIQTTGYSAGAFTALRAELRRKAASQKLDEKAVLAIVADAIPSDIGAMRRYQELQALLNCTRRSLLPVAFRDLRGAAWDAKRLEWEVEIRALEARGIR
ncbi:MAG: ATP-binding protein [Candidatus Uhrbacteria bacterium]